MLVRRYRDMLRLRRFEERVSTVYRDGAIPGSVHLCIGQEATAVGVCSELRPSDFVTSTHRGHGHCLAKGSDMAAMFAELMGRVGGTCRGRGGSMHIADPGRGILGANGIVGACLPIAVGAAAASRRRGDHAVAVAFFGDGAIAAVPFHEAVNLAAVHGLPVPFLCENNRYAEFSPIETQHPVLPVERIAAYGIPATQVDGNDAEAVAALVAEEVASLRAGGGPRFVEALRYRWQRHYEGDPERYRGPDEVEEWRSNDPLARLARRLDEAGAGEARQQAVREVDGEVAAALAGATSTPEPAAATLADFIVRSRPSVAERGVAREAPMFRTMDAVHDALDYALEHDPDVWIAGIDVAAGGNVFGLTRGLADAYPGRVVDTPISEIAIIGMGVGAAMAGTRPVVEMMYFDFVGTCLDQIMNQAAKLLFMTGGNAPMALVIRTQFGAGHSSGSQHSQSLEALLAHIPGLTVVMPSTPADTYELLLAAIDDPNLVVFVENRLLYGMKGPTPERGHVVPIGSAAVRRQGADVTVVSWSRMVHDVLAAAEQVAGDGIDVEVIDLRAVAPADIDTVVTSVSRMSRLLVAHEAVLTGGIGAEIAAVVAEVLLRRTGRTHRAIADAGAIRPGPRASVAARRSRDRRRRPPAVQRVRSVS
jgi:2-oxoisovalerate dehydrogenase E1 component